MRHVDAGRGRLERRAACSGQGSSEPLRWHCGGGEAREGGFIGGGFTSQQGAASLVEI